MKSSEIQDKLPFARRIIQLVAMLMSVSALLAAVLGVSWLSNVYKQYYIRAETGHALPKLTMFVLSWVDHRLFLLAGLVVVALVFCCTAGYLFLRPARPEQHSLIIAMVSITWLCALLILGTVTISLALPFIEHFR